MGLFDFFKNTEGAQSTEPGKATEQITSMIQQGILDNTQAIANLLAVPREERTEAWLNEFLTKLPLAAFRCGTPQVIAGPDGFPYFQLFVPEPGEEFQSFVIDEMINGFLLERGFGVVINPGATQPEWILTYGDILNFHLNGSFFTLDSAFSNTGNPEATGQGGEILMASPSEKILPAATRKLLKDFFELNGINNPKVTLVVHKTGEETIQDLAFNITAASFDTEEHYRNMMQTVTWYLPRHYSVIGLDEQQVNNGFTAL